MPAIRDIWKGFLQSIYNLCSALTGLSKNGHKFEQKKVNTYMLFDMIREEIPTGLSEIGHKFEQKK